LYLVRYFVRFACPYFHGVQNPPGEQGGFVLLCDRFDSRRDNRHVLEHADIFQRLFDYHSVEVPERFHIFDPDAMASHKGYSEFRCLQHEYKMAVP